LELNEDGSQRIDYGLDSNAEYRITSNGPAEQALSELNNVDAYMNNTAIPEARQRLNEERAKFDELAGDIELSADPNIRTQLQDELSQMEARERELEAISRGEQPPAAAGAEAVNPNQALIDENAELRRQLEEERGRRDASRQRWLKIGTFVAGAVVGAALVASAVPVATVATLAAISGVLSVGSKLLNTFVIRRSINYLQNSPEARENLTEEERNRRLRNYQRLSNGLGYFTAFTFGFGLTAGVGSALEGWLSNSAGTAAGTGDAVAKGAEKGADFGSAARIDALGDGITAVPGDSQWSMIEKVLRQSYPNLSNDQILNATGNIIQQAGPEQVYSTVFAHRTPDIVGGAIQVGDKLNLADLTQIAPDIIQSLGG
jgi:hypothetical protein